MVDAVIRHQLVTDAFVDVHEMLDALLMSKLAEQLMVLRLLLRGTGCIMIEEDDGLLWVMDAFAAHFIKRLDDLIIEIIDAGDVHLTIHDFSCMYRCETRFFGQQLFNCVHDVLSSRFT